MSRNREAPNAEPTLDEILNDPIVRLLMRGDHTAEGEVRRVIEQARAALDSAGTEDAARPAQKTKRTRRSHAA